MLFLGGLLLNILALLGGLDPLMAKGSTGFVGFDLVALLQQICSSQIAGVGFIILVSGGFAAYMQAIGASDRFVTVCAKPLSYVRNPYLILALVFIFGHCLSLVITSAAGLAMLMVVTVYPLIIRVGCSSLSAAAVVASVLIIGYAPASGTANLAAELVGLEPIEYFVKYQLPLAVPTVLAMAATHVVVQYWFDRREGRGVAADLEELAEKRRGLEKAPAFYAVFPVLPIVFLLIFNKMVFKTVTMNVPTAMFLCWLLAFLADLLVRRNVRESFDLSFAMFKGMGSILTSTVGLIFVAAFFAKGPQNVGIVDLLLSGANGLGLGSIGMGIVLSAIIGVVTVLTGSGVAAFTSLGHIVPDVAAGMGVDPYYLMDQQAARAPIGCNRLIYLPYLMGERSPVWDAYARGEFFGLSLKTTRREMNRAVLEGCAYGLRQMFDICEELTGEKITHFSSIGGGAKSKVWAQIKADITGRDITVLDMSDMAPVGAALLAGVGAGVFKDVYEASAKVEKAVYTKIKHSDADKEVYDRRYQVYTGLYPRLKDLYRVNLGIKEN